MSQSTFESSASLIDSISWVVGIFSYLVIKDWVDSTLLGCLGGLVGLTGASHLVPFLLGFRASSRRLTANQLFDLQIIGGRNLQLSKTATWVAAGVVIAILVMGIVSRNWEVLATGLLVGAALAWYVIGTKQALTRIADGTSRAFLLYSNEIPKPPIEPPPIAAQWRLPE